ncbi:hypothetical protein ACFL11_00650 [Patescibacteria group bacterium]
MAGLIILAYLWCSAFSSVAAAVIIYVEVTKRARVTFSAEWLKWSNPAMLYSLFVHLAAIALFWPLGLFITKEAINHLFSIYVLDCERRLEKKIK